MDTPRTELIRGTERVIRHFIKVSLPDRLYTNLSLMLSCDYVVNVKYKLIYF